MPHASSWPGRLSLGGEFCLVLLLTSSWLIDGLVYWPGGPRQRVLEGKKKKNQTHIKIGGPLTSCTVTTASSAWEGRWVRKDAAATWRSGANLRAPCSASVNFKSNFLYCWCH